MTKLDELMKCIHNDHVYIQMHNFPDQDAIASARGLQYLLESKGKVATIVYHGIIDKENTIMMINLLNIKLIPIEYIQFNTNDEIILVDGQKGNINMHGLKGNVIACIDHHKKQNTDCYLYYDIQSNAGACSSIIASYYKENNIEIPVDIATALVYGQRIDTTFMTRNVSEIDIDMFYFLYKVANHSQLRRFDTSTMNVNNLENYQNAISNLRIYGYVGISNVGNDCSEAMIGSISDFLLTLSEIEFTLLYSYRAGGLKFSIRCTWDTIDVSEIINHALEGYGEGGGHSDMAAGFIPQIATEHEAMEIAKIIEQRVVELINAQIKAEQMNMQI